MPYECKFCGQKFCVEHRLPENHDCPGLEEHKQQMRDSGKMFDRKDLKTTSKTEKSFFTKYLIPFKSNVAYLLLAIMIISFLVQQTLYSTNPSLAQTIYELGITKDQMWISVISEKPWTLVTSIFAHAGSLHLLFNGIVLFFFGPQLERLVGSKRFLGLFLGAGILAGLSQVIATDLILSPQRTFIVLGASGAIFAILGAQTIFTPNMKILLMFIPVRLWIATLLLVLMNLVFVGGSGVANVAHLTGVTIGILTGFYYRDKIGLKRSGSQLNFGNRGGPF
ncbi:rhomboid family intramembrane serine protease [archaeon SCG-AAA382B04]|nr:rhomboid family intramembrane serine protease [archaeon SCG-AAA382B04]